MSDKGATYTIVVDKNQDIISVTHNGKPMTKEGEGDPPVPPVERDMQGVPVDMDPPQGYSGCICLGDRPDVPGGIDISRFSKIF